MTNISRPEEKQAYKQVVCMGCGGTSFTKDYVRGESICATCGLVISERTADRGPEWRAFTTEERNARARAGAPMTFTIADRGLSTTISRRNKDASGRVLLGKTRAAIYRMRKWHIRSRLHGSQIRNLSVAMGEMDRLSSQIGIPRNVKETAALIYRKALAKKIVRGRSIEAVVAASVYLACRIHKVPRRLDEIVVETNLDRKKVGQAVRLVVSKVNVKIPVPSAKNLIPRLSSDLLLEGKTVKKATEIIKNAEEKFVTIGKDPGGIAGAALYIAGILEEDRRTQREIAKAARVTEVTIRNRYKDLVRSLGISLNPES
jgi:transcription initiation factor TFIIB